MVRQAVEERRGHLGVAGDTRPVAEGEIGGHDDGGLLVEAADQVEQQLPTRLGEGQVAKLVQNDQVEPDQMLGGASLTAGPGLGFKPVDQIDDREEPGAGAAPDAAARDGDRLRRTGKTSGR